MTRLTKAGLMAAAGFAAIGAIAFTTSGPQLARAADQPAGGQECFNTRLLNGFNAPNDRTLYIRVGVNDIFRLDLAPGCTDLAFRQDIGLRSVPPGDSFICSPLQTEVTFSETGMRERCQVSAMHKLTPDERAALPKKDRP